MKFIIETVKSFFEKADPKYKEKLGLTKEQKKKYSKQFRQEVFPIFLLLIIIVFGIGNAIFLFFKDHSILYVAIAVLLVYKLEDVLKEGISIIQLIEERMQKRAKKNIKQQRDDVE